MKDQYIGDINDFHKYALLRALGDALRAPLRVCWMLTPADGRRDGGRLAYLNGPSEFRNFDPPLFDALAELVSQDRRNVQALQATGLLPNATFHPAILADDSAERDRYFANVHSSLGPDELVFFDPDNGLEVPSTPRGRRGSAKYLYWDELEGALGEGRTICVYQHFPRRPRATFLAGLLERMSDLVPGHMTFAVTSSWVAYAICAPHGRAKGLVEVAAEVAVRPGSGLRFVSNDGASALSWHQSRPASIVPGFAMGTSTTRSSTISEDS
jgi:hypothetical protein